jgi:hypothetical protein
MLTRSSLTHLKVSLMVSPGFFRLFGCSFFKVFSVIYYGAFCFYVSTNFILLFVENWGNVIFSSFVVSVFDL